MAPREVDTSDKNPANVNKYPYLKPHHLPTAYLRPLKKQKKQQTTTENRVRAGKHHGALNFGNDLTKVLYAFGAPIHPDLKEADPHPDSKAYLARLPTANTTHRPTSFAGTDTPGQPFPETLRVLDEILTDFIIEICHEAVDHATYEGRHKVNNNDINWVFRNNKTMLGRLKAMSDRQKKMKAYKDIAGEGDGVLKEMGKKITLDEMQYLAEMGGEQGTGKGLGRGKGRRKRKNVDAGVDGGEGEAVGSQVDGASDGMDEDDDLEEGRSVKRARMED